MENLWRLVSEWFDFFDVFIKFGLFRNGLFICVSKRYFYKRIIDELNSFKDILSIEVLYDFLYLSN